MGQSIIADTNVLINNFEILNKENLIIPYRILNELDGLKKDRDIGYKVRKVVRIILENNIECKQFKRINEEVPTDDGLIRIGLKNDIKIITQDYLLYEKGLTKDINIEFYKPQEEVYKGVIEDSLSGEKVDKLYDKGKIQTNRNMYENQFLDAEDIVCRYKNGYLYKIDWNTTVNGLDDSPTRRQLMALDVLFDKDVKLISLYGKPGVGKTTISLNSAISQVANGDFSKLLISRAKKKRNIDEGFAALPGELEEKYAPFTEPFYDNLYTQTPIHFQVVPLSSIQGRNLSDAQWIITEAQDLSPDDMKLVVSRCADNTNLILEGDLNQNSDNTLNKHYNGLTHTINTLKESSLTATVKLDEIKRGELAELSTKL